MLKQPSFNVSTGRHDLQADCVLVSDKCSATNEFCETRRSANVAVAMATGTADPNRLSRGETRDEPARTQRTGLLDAAWWGEDKKEDTDAPGEPDPAAPPLQGQIGVKSLCPEGLSLFALRSRVAPRTKQLPHVPPAHKDGRLRLGRHADDGSFQRICVNTQKLG